MTVSQVRLIFTLLLQQQLPSGVVAISELINRVLERNEKARIYHWYENTGSLPPPHPRPERPAKQTRSKSHKKKAAQ